MNNSLANGGRINPFKQPQEESQGNEPSEYEASSYYYDEDDLANNDATVMRPA